MLSAERKSWENWEITTLIPVSHYVERGLPEKASVDRKRRKKTEGKWSENVSTGVDGSTGTGFWVAGPTFKPKSGTIDGLVDRWCLASMKLPETRDELTKKYTLGVYAMSIVQLQDAEYGFNLPEGWGNKRIWDQGEGDIDSCFNKQGIRVGTRNSGHDCQNPFPDADCPGPYIDYFWKGTGLTCTLSNNVGMVSLWSSTSNKKGKCMCKRADPTTIEDWQGDIFQYGFDSRLHSYRKIRTEADQCWNEVTQSCEIAKDLLRDELHDAREEMLRLAAFERRSAKRHDELVEEGERESLQRTAERNGPLSQYSPAGPWDTPEMERNKRIARAQNTYGLGAGTYGEWKHNANMLAQALGTNGDINLAIRMFEQQNHKQQCGLILPSCVSVMKYMMADMTSEELKEFVFSPEMGMLILKGLKSIASLPSALTSGDYDQMTTYNMIASVEAHSNPQETGTGLPKALSKEERERQEKWQKMANGFSNYIVYNGAQNSKNLITTLLPIWDIARYADCVEDWLSQKSRGVGTVTDEERALATRMKEMNDKIDRYGWTKGKKNIVGETGYDTFDAELTKNVNGETPDIYFLDPDELVGLLESLTVLVSNTESWADLKKVKAEEGEEHAAGDTPR